MNPVEPSEKNGEGPALQVPLPWQESAWRQLARARREGRLPHALLAFGPKGLGKGAFAETLARALLCAEPLDSGHACGRCRDCRLSAAGTHPDLHRLTPETEGGVLSIDAIRESREKTILAVGEGRRRVFLIFPAEAMTTAAANALLKTLEEPPPGIHMLLVSHQPERLPVTIRSRCNLLPFRPPPEGMALRWLQAQGIPAERAQVALRLAGGGPLGALARIESGEAEAAARRLTQLVALVRGEAAPWTVAEQWLGERALADLLAELTIWLHLLLRRIHGGKLSDPLPDIVIQPANLHEFLDKLFESLRRLPHNPNPQLTLEALLVEWCRIARSR